MAKIKIIGSAEELERVSNFLTNNNIKFKVKSDFGNHSLVDSEKYSKLIEKFK